MDSTVSFRAKSPVRRQKKKTKNKIPFLAGKDDNNMVAYTQAYIQGTLVHSYVFDGYF